MNKIKKGHSRKNIYSINKKLAHGNLSRKITIAYAFSLAVIGFLIIAGHIALTNVIGTQEKGLEIMKDISRQRVLSQKISFLALSLSVEKDSSKRSELYDTLEKSIYAMSDAHNQLITQRAEWDQLVRYADEDKSEYINPPVNLNKRIQSFLAKSRNFLLANDIAGSDRPKASEVAAIVSIGSDSLLESLEYAVKRYEKITRDRIRFLKNLETFFILTTLILLCIVAGFIFRPLVKKIKKYNADLNRSARELATVIDTVGEGIISCDEKGIIIGANKEAVKLWKTSKKKLIGKNIENILLSNSETNILTDTLDHNDNWIEMEALVQDGDNIPVEIINNAIEVSGEIMLVIAIRDISKRKEDEKSIKKSLQEKMVLLQEIHHRVKNNLQIITSFLNLQSRNIEDPKIKAVLQESRNRVNAMSLIHQELYRSDDFSKIDFKGYIQQLSRNLIGVLNISHKHIDLELDIGEVNLSLDSAIPCGLIINELITNSVEHAFNDVENPKINISITPAQGYDWKLCVSDNGKGLKEEFNLDNAKSMGLRLVKALASQLQGKLDIQSSQGTSFTICFNDEINILEEEKHGT